MANEKEKATIADSADDSQTPSSPVGHSPQTQIALTQDLKSALATMKPLDRITFLSKVTEYVGADTVDTNSILNVPIKVGGVLIHEATIRQDDKVDLVTGELTASYSSAKRVVFKGDEGKMYGFVSMSIESFCRDFLVPAFGIGDWVDENGNPLFVTIVIRQATSKGGRVYVVQILDK